MTHRTYTHRFLISLATCVSAITLSASTGSGPLPGGATPGKELRQTAANYFLGTADQITIHVADMDDLDGKTYTLDQQGNITVPLLGVIHASGYTAVQLQGELSIQLRAFMKEPRVTVSLVQMRSEPVFLTGSFKSPGVFQLQGRRSLLEVLAQAGGLSPDAGDRIRVTRRTDMGTLPLPHARLDPNGTTYSAELRLGKSQNELGPEENIVLDPYDVVWAAPAAVVFVNGEVGKPGSLPLRGERSIPLSHLLAESGGLREEASSRVRILRPVENTLTRREILVDLDKIFHGNAPDIELYPEDILYVPRDTKRLFWSKTIGMTLPMTIPWLGAAF
jgi:polysaccharide export outer membrane protein